MYLTEAFFADLYGNPLGRKRQARTPLLIVIRILFTNRTTRPEINHRLCYYTKNTQSEEF